MFAAVTFTQTTGMRICIDAWDVCSVVEKLLGTEITYVLTDEPDIFVTKSTFEEVLELLQEARSREPRKYGDGDEWKNKGYDDGED